MIRETALLVLPLPYREAFRWVSRQVYDQGLEDFGIAGESRAPVQRDMLTAVAEDLRHLAEYLKSLGRDRETNTLAEADLALSFLASAQAAEVGRAASVLERALAPVDPPAPIRPGA